MATRGDEAKFEFSQFTKTTKLLSHYDNTEQEWKQNGENYHETLE